MWIYQTVRSKADAGMGGTNCREQMQTQIAFGRSLPHPPLRLERVREGRLGKDLIAWQTTDSPSAASDRTQLRL